MDILDMTKKDFDAVPRLDTYNDTDWEKLAPNGRLEFRSFVIIPVYNEDGTIDHTIPVGAVWNSALLISTTNPLAKSAEVLMLLISTVLADTETTGLSLPGFLVSFRFMAGRSISCHVDI